jgi:Pyridoxamine 5'-phosphate oxidase
MSAYTFVMGRVLDRIDESTANWIARQHLFFVATAPAEGGRVNLSPKGLDSFRVLDATEIAYLDLTGSGAETIAHVRDNGRITFMFCAFNGPPRIVRLYGKGSVHLPDSGGFDELNTLFPHRRGVRSIITTKIERVQDSCGYSVPLMEFTADRTRLDSWTDHRTDRELVEYWHDRNAISIDGLPALGPE